MGVNKTSWRDVTEAELAATGKVKRPQTRTGEQIFEIQNAHNRATMPQGWSKYRNVKTVVDGVGVFDSGKEAARWRDLELLQKAGQIRYLKRQVPFSCDVIRPEGFPPVRHLGVWVSDFTYEERRDPGLWFPIAEDSKGMKTPLYRWKKRHVEAQYGIEIRET